MKERRNGVQKKISARKQQILMHAGIRILVQAVFFAALPSAYSAAFAGIKGIFAQIGKGQLLTFSPFIAILAVLLLYTIVFGRFFCGYACAFGSLGDWIYGIRKFLCARLTRKKNRNKAGGVYARADALLMWAKYLILGGIILLVYLGLYDRLRGTSPWDVFSMLRAGRLPDRTYAYGAGVLLAILIGMAVKERFFCRYLCPMGAVFSILPVLPLFTLVRNRANCLKKCSHCKDVCPSHIELGNTRSYEVSGECFACGRCVGACPKSNVRTKCPCGREAVIPGPDGNPEPAYRMKYLKGNELLFVLLRAVLLAGLLKTAGM